MRKALFEDSIPLPLLALGIDSPIAFKWLPGEEMNHAKKKDLIHLHP